MVLSAGTRLGPYEILTALGAGGMGEVYKARDTRLERDVAIKVLPAQLTDTAQARERFQREGRAIAALQHPNICTVHDVGETGGGHAFLVMELLAGETLQRRLTRGSLGESTAVDLAAALADALDAAHRAGVVHRDIKPGNIFLTTHGPKILDFGLAKTISRDAPAVSMQPTITAAGPLTDQGSTVGTVAYMSPEQLRAEDVDARTDLFALGLVLYEMTTGCPAFSGATSAVISAAILHEQPRPPRQIRPDLSVRLEEIIAKAIEKDGNLRYQHASDLRADLRRAQRDTGSPQAVATAPAPPMPRRTHWWLASAAVVAVVVAVAIAAWYVRSHRAPVLTDKDTIVLADFTNTTGDPVFDETLRQGLTVQLEQSPFLSVVSDERVRRTLQLMDRPPNAPLTRDLARDVCVRTGSTAVVTGSIAGLGNQYVLGLRAELCGSGDLLDQEQLQAPRKEEVLNVLSQLASKFRTRAGESLTTVQKHATPLEEATTPALDALKAYSAARSLSNLGTTVPLLKRAVQIDPNFAMAHAMLALAYSARGEAVLGEESANRAYQLRDHANDRERFLIATMYDRQVTGNLEREAETMRLWAQAYPRDPAAVGLLGGFASAGTGNYELQIQSGKQAIALDPDATSAFAGYLNMVHGSVSLGRLSDAEQALEQAIGRRPDAPNALMHAYDIAFLKGDAGGMERVVAQAKDKPAVEDWIAHLQALTLARSARLKEARRSARGAIDLASAGGQRERAAVWETGMAVWEGLYGNAEAAKRSATHVLEIAKGRHVTYAAAMALANAGERSRAQAIGDDLDRRYPEDTSVRFAYVPALRAMAALNAHDPPRAIDVLRPATRYELAQPGISFTGAGGGSFGAMYPTYLRGEAYLALNQGRDAAAEFQRILDHPGVILMDPIGALARLQLGRAWAQAGDPAKARAAYADLLELWKDADPDIAIVQQARAEYGKLQ